MTDRTPLSPERLEEARAMAAMLKAGDGGPWAKLLADALPEVFSALLDSHAALQSRLDRLEKAVKVWTSDHADYGPCSCSLCSALAVSDGDSDEPEDGKYGDWRDRGFAGA